MREIIYNPSNTLRDPQKTYEMLKLTEYICKEFNLYISVYDAYCMWRDVSVDVFKRDWVCIDRIRFDLDKKAFIAYCLDTYCIFVEEYE